MSRPGLRIVVLGVVAFAITLIVLCPARWAAAALPAGVECDGWTGSLWNGQCDNLRWQARGPAPVSVGKLRWRLHALTLLRAKLRADVELEQEMAQARGRVTAGSDSLQVEALNASGTLDRRLLAALPAGWSARFEVRDAQFVNRGGKLQQLQGVFIARELRDQRGAGLGDYQLQFSPQPAAPFNGQLRDLAGPLQLNATVRIDADRSWQLDGVAVLRPGAPQSLARGLDQLGSADLNGQRRISIAGTVD